MRSGRTHAFAERFAPKKSAFKFISIVICLEEGAKCGRKRITIQELFENPDSDPSFYGRSPHGERGLKSTNVYYTFCTIQSLPARGAWIEIIMEIGEKPCCAGRSPHGERGLKCPYPG